MSLFGDVFSGVTSLFGTSMTNSANAKQAENQMSFQERMSNTQYQRAVADLKAAGLNPMLAYSNGGASSPAGAQATMQNPLQNAVSTALQSKELNAKIENLKADTEEKNSARDLNIDRSWSERATQDLLTQQVASAEQSRRFEAEKFPAMLSQLSAQSREANISSALAALQLPAAQNEAEFNKAVESYPFVKNLLGLVKDMTGAASSARSATSTHGGYYGR